MGTGAGALIGLLGTTVLIGVALNTIQQIDIQSKKIIKPTKMILPRLNI